MLFDDQNGLIDSIIAVRSTYKKHEKVRMPIAKMEK